MVSNKYVLIEKRQLWALNLQYNYHPLINSYRAKKRMIHKPTTYFNVVLITQAIQKKTVLLLEQFFLFSFKSQIIPRSNVFIIIFTYLKLIYWSTITLEYSTGQSHLLNQPAEYSMAILDLYIYFRVSKNCDEKRYFLKYFGFNSFH